MYLFSFCCAQVRVIVEHAVNTAPRVHINTLGVGSGAVVVLPENATLGTFVALVTADDDDDGDDGQVTCQLQRDAILALRVMRSKGFTLTLRAHLDRESRDTHHVTVTCQDGGRPPLSADTTLVVRVGDVNDNDPVFVRQTFLLDLQEGNYSHTNIMQKGLLVCCFIPLSVVLCGICYEQQ